SSPLSKRRALSRDCGDGEFISELMNLLRFKNRTYRPYESYRSYRCQISLFTASSNPGQSSLARGRYATRPLPKILKSLFVTLGPTERVRIFCGRARRQGSRRPVDSVTIRPPPFSEYSSNFAASSSER